MAKIRILKSRRKWYMVGLTKTPQEFCLPTPYDHSPPNEKQKEKNRKVAQLFADATEAVRRGLSFDQVDPRLRPLMKAILQAASEISIVIWLVAWIRWHCLSHRLSLGHTRNLCFRADRFLVYVSSKDLLAAPELKMGGVRDTDLVKFLAWLRNKQNFALSSVNNDYRFLKTVFRSAVTGRVLQSNPLSGVAPMSHEKGIIRLAFPIEEALRILNFCPNWGARGKEWEFVLCIATATPLKLHIIIRLKRSNFRLEEGVPRIVFRPTSKTGEDVVALNDETAAFVERYLRELDPNTEYCTPILAHRKNSSVSRSFNELMRHSGIDKQSILERKRKVAKKSFDSFRHFIKGALKANGCTFTEILWFSRHSRIPSTSTFTHMIPGWDLAKARLQKEAASRIPSLAKRLTSDLTRGQS